MKQYDYAERLWIHWSIPAFLTFIAGSLAIAYGRVYGPQFGIGTCFVCSVEHRNQLPLCGSLPTHLAIAGCTSNAR